MFCQLVSIIYAEEQAEIAKRVKRFISMYEQLKRLILQFTVTFFVWEILSFPVNDIGENHIPNRTVLSD